MDKRFVSWYIVELQRLNAEALRLQAEYEATVEDGMDTYSIEHNLGTNADEFLALKEQAFEDGISCEIFERLDNEALHAVKAGEVSKA